MSAHTPAPRNDCAERFTASKSAHNLRKRSRTAAQQTHMHARTTCAARPTPPRNASSHSAHPRVNQKSHSPIIPLTKHTARHSARARGPNLCSAPRHRAMPNPPSSTSIVIQMTRHRAAILTHHLPSRNSTRIAAALGPPHQASEHGQIAEPRSGPTEQDTTSDSVKERPQIAHRAFPRLGPHRRAHLDGLSNAAFSAHRGAAWSGVVELGVKESSMVTIRALCGDEGTLGVLSGVLWD